MTLALTATADADVYQCDETAEGGVISLSNVGQTARCQKMVLQPKPKNRPAFNPIEEKKETTRRTSPGSTEAVAERRRILEEEIELERRRLKEASARVVELEKSAESKDRQRAILSAQQKESLHRSNIGLLEKELGRI